VGSRSTCCEMRNLLRSPNASVIFSAGP
jgi:hypothetical protein